MGVVEFTTKAAQANVARRRASGAVAHWSEDDIA
jgi:hypothetical protein